MKKFLLLSVFAFLLSVNVVAQDDDMYFVPTKKNVEKAKKDYGMPHDTYYSGSDRSVDEYNRRIPGSSVTAIDSLGNDIINLDGEVGEYPDSLGDYTYTRKMSRWDDYEWKDGYRAGYADGRFGTWGWGGYYPYYSGWYGGWYDPWFYDPWYYGWGYAGWYSPWYYGYGYGWGWGYPHYWHNHYWGGWYPGGGIAYYRGSTGTRNHSAGRGSSNHSGYNYRRYNSVGNNRGYANNNRYNNNTNTNRNMNFGGVRNSNGNTYQNNSSFGGTRSNGGGFSGGGGSRGGGGSFGGGSRGGGGHFGGGRR